VKNRLIYIAKVVSTHGLKGELKIYTYLDDPKSIIKFKKLFDKNGNEIFKIQNIKFHKNNMVIASMLNSSTKNEADSFVGKKIYIDKVELKPTDKNEFYYNDLIKLKVENEKGELIGTIVNVHNFGAGNIIEIKENQSSETFMLPFTESFFPKVFVGRKVIVSLPLN
tara:strand:- start:1222 stop:1722 length:501 start_codon:yes stop_codon:yes gene_type:complete